MYLMIFKEFARKILKNDIIQTIKTLKSFKKLTTIDYKNDILYLYFLNDLQSKFKNRQRNNFKEYKKLYSWYKNVVKNYDIKKGITIKEYNNFIKENFT